MIIEMINNKEVTQKFDSYEELIKYLNDADPHTKIIVKEPDKVAVLETDHYKTEAKEDEEGLGIIVDVFDRHGELIETNTYWNCDIEED